jgi:hypothetical protein
MLQSSSHPEFHNSLPLPACGMLKKQTGRGSGLMQKQTESVNELMKIHNALKLSWMSD